MELMRYSDATTIRTATYAEYQASSRAAKHDGGAGIITVDGVDCYVSGEPSVIIGGYTVQLDRSGQGHAWRDATVHDIGSVMAELEGWIIDGGAKDGDTRRASNGLMYRVVNK